MSIVRREIAPTKPLKPCPCGAGAKMIRSSSHVPGCEAYAAMCSNVECERVAQSDWYQTESGARTDWHNRIHSVPRAPYLHAVEVIHYGGGRPGLIRTRVPGGWLYTTTDGAAGCPTAIASNFVPDVSRNVT